MALVKIVRRFSKTGKGLPQVEQLDDDGKPILDKDQKPVIGNEQFTCEQLTDASIAWEDVKNEAGEVITPAAEAFLTDVFESVNGDLEKAAEMFRTGWNRVTRLEAGGMDEYTKAARVLLKNNLPGFKGLTLEEAIERLKSMS